MTYVLLFVYGTLKRGGRAEHFLTDQEFLGTATTRPRYRLYDKGTYPCLVDDPNGVEVHGEVWRVENDRVAAVDEYEGVWDLYDRRAIELDGFPTDEPVLAYFYNGPVGGLIDCGGEWPVA